LNVDARAHVLHGASARQIDHRGSSQRGFLRGGNVERGDCDLDLGEWQSEGSGPLRDIAHKRAAGAAFVLGCVNLEVAAGLVGAGDGEGGLSFPGHPGVALLPVSHPGIWAQSKKGKRYQREHDEQNEQSGALRVASEYPHGLLRWPVLRAALSARSLYLYLHSIRHRRFTPGTYPMYALSADLAFLTHGPSRPPETSIPVGP
jgi:hypothetical protein